VVLGAKKTWEHRCKEMKVMEMTNQKQWGAPQVTEEESLRIQTGCMEKAQCRGCSEVPNTSTKSYLSFSCFRTAFFSRRHS